MKLGPTLTAICKQRGLSLARLSRASGVPTQTLHGWCVGRKGVRLDQLKKVAEALEVSIHHLAFGETDPYEGVGREVLKELFSGDVRITVHKIERGRK